MQDCSNQLHSGYCSRCGKTHALPSLQAQPKARELFNLLEKHGSLDIFSSGEPRHPGNNYTTDSLFTEERGKMFGVLECLDAQGNQTWLYAFSGQFNGLWHVPGWVPPLFDIAQYSEIHDPVEKRIKKLGSQMENLPKKSAEYVKLQELRKQISQNLMRDIHNLYRVHNFSSEQADLHQAFDSPNGKPTGTGDCCAPKLLNFAAQSHLAPISMAEFFFGRENKSGTRVHGTFYPSCNDKCRQLLGFMLCGAEQLRNKYGCRN